MIRNASNGEEKLREIAKQVEQPPSGRNRTYDDLRADADQLRMTLAQEEKKIKVFLAYLSHDEEPAQLLKAALTMYCGDKVDVIGMSEVQAGVEWRHDIVAKVIGAEWFILLYSGAAVDWAWCHEEAGLFLGSRYGHTNKLTVVHPEGIKLPALLEGFNSVPCPSLSMREFDQQYASAKNALELPAFKRVSSFFDAFFIEEPYAGFGSLCSDVITNSEKRDNVIRKLVDAVGRLTTVTCDPRYTMQIDVPDPNHITEDAFPDGTMISPGDAGPELFAIGVQRCSWAEFSNQMREGTGRNVWRSIRKACKKSAMQELLWPIYAVFQKKGGLDRYRPVLLHLEKSGNKSCRFKLGFVRAVEPAPHDNAEQRIVTGLTLTYRFRTLVLDELGDRLKLEEFIRKHVQYNSHSRSEDELTREALREIKELVDDIVIEAEELGVSSPRMIDDFKKPEDREWARDAMIFWQRAERILEDAVSGGDKEVLLELFQRLSPMNAAGIELGMTRVLELLKERVKPSRELPDLSPLEERLAVGRSEGRA
jgi:hypothetical protein